MYSVPFENFAGQIESAAAGILVEIAQNIGQLQSPAERLSDSMGSITRIAKDVNREMANCAGNPRAVKVKHCEIRSANGLSCVHLHAIYNGHEIIPAQMVA